MPSTTLSPTQVGSAIESLTATTSPSDGGLVYRSLTGLGLRHSTASDVQAYSVGPLRILLVVLVAFVLSRLVSRLADRLVASMRLISPLVRATPRGADRARTLAGMFASIFKALVWIIAGLTILGQLRIDLAPFVATATVVGAAVGFGAQSLVKDVLSGVLILAEDQYGVGDTITIASSTTSGVVESVNLRTTRVRSLDGMVWYVPNGDIRAVGNSAETDSTALVDVVVPHGTDLASAGAAAEAAARALATRPEWEAVILAAPTFVGVQASDNEGVTLRVTAQTMPGRHVEAGRELRLAILEQLREDHLAWAMPPPPPSPTLPSPTLP